MQNDKLMTKGAEYASDGQVPTMKVYEEHISISFEMYMYIEWIKSFFWIFLITKKLNLNTLSRWKYENELQYMK